MPILNIPDRICSHCGEIKYYINSKGYPECYKKRAENRKKWFERNKEKVEIQKRLWDKNNKEKIKISHNLYNERNKEKIREKKYARRKTEKGILERRKEKKSITQRLPDYYIKYQLKTLGIFSPTKSNINLYREYLKTKRICLQIEKQD